MAETTSGVGTEMYSEGNCVVIIPPDKTDKYIPKKYSSKIHGIDRIDISITPDDVIKAEIQLTCNFEPITAQAHYYMINPKSGESEEIKSIEFESGERWDNGQ